MPILKEIGKSNLGRNMERELNEILNELNLEDSLKVIVISEENSHNKIAICNNDDWKNNIHLSIFDNYLKKKYLTALRLLSIDSAKNINHINKEIIENTKELFINQSFLFDSVGSGFMLATFENMILSVNDKNKIKDALNILITIYEQNNHE